MHIETVNPDLNPVIDDWSGWMISGRVKSHVSDSPYATAARTPAQGVQDGIDAERLGYRRVYISERLNLKEAGAFLGGIAAKTSRLEIGTAMATPGYHHPLHAAALGATMQACYGPRFILGVGKGGDTWFHGTGMMESSYRALIDYVDIIRRLWRGETVTYDGPAGRYVGMDMQDIYEGPPPQIWYGCFGLTKAAQTAAAAFDAVFLHPMFTPEATAGAVRRMRAACERIGRDPASLRVIQPIVTAPDLSDYETRALCHARAVTYLQIPGYGEALVEANGWDPKLLDRVRNHGQVAGTDVIADFRYHRVELMEVAKLVPDSYMERSCGIGSVDQALKVAKSLREAGADEIATYGSTPAQNAGLLDAWRADKLAATSKHPVGVS